MGEQRDNQQSQGMDVQAQGQIPAGVPGQDDVLQVLAEFEQGLRGLKQLYAERQVLQSTLQQRETSVREREEALSAKIAELEQAHATLEEQGREVLRAREAAEARRAELEAREGELKRLGAEVERTTVALRARNEELTRWAQEQEARQAALEGEGKQLAASKAEVDAMRGKLTAARREIEQAARATAELEHRRAEIAGESERVATARAELESMQVRLATAREEIEEAQRVSAELDRRRAELEAQAKRLGEERGAWQGKSGEVKELGARREAMLAEIEQIEARRGEAGSLAKALDRAQAEASGKAREVEQLRAELAQARAVAESREAGLAQNLGEAQAMSQEVGALKDVISEYEALWRVELEHSAELEARANAPAPGPGAEVAELEGLVEELRNRLRDEIAKRRQAEGRIEELTQAGQAARADVERAQAGWGTTSGMGDAALARRRERLSLARRLVRERREKLDVAGDALKKRFEQCDKIIAMRSELATGFEKVKTAEKRQQRQTSAGRVAMAMLCWVATLGILSAMSWAISRQFVPGQYAAQTIVVPDGQGRSLSDGELLEWQRYHEELVKDPRFAEVVSKRMARKGMAEYATPAAVSEVLEKRLSLESSKAGELKLELRGEGSAKTERELDTIATALAGEANAARTGQAHGAVTQPPAPSSTGGNPLDHSQLVAAGGMLVFGFGLTSVAALMLWRKLTRVKTRFELDQQLAATLDDARWPEPVGR